ncbi:MAG: ABC transporter substrate-binding protein [Proteobacteria bacterium]|nr:MAG: ABC transporter substrate-binding protein [Pseudomonadota bacterium]
MRRREFITLIGGATALPLAARAQQPGLPVIGFLSIATPEAWADYVSAFKQGLGQTGFAEGQNVAIEYRWAGSDYGRFPTLVKELVDRRVSVIVANGGGRVALVAKAATSDIPIVFLFGDGDPVKYGLVESISRPGGNVTGVTMIAGVLEPKRLEFLREIAPKLTAVHILVNPNNAGVLQDIPTVAAAAGKLGLAFEVVQAGTESEIDAAFATLARERAQALMVANDGFLTIRRAQIVALAARHALPAIYPWREYAAAGGLISYGTSIREAHRQEGVYVGQVLKGRKPAELPVQQPTKFELVINAKTAKALGLEIPMSLLMRVDEVIE